MLDKDVETFKRGVEFGYKECIDLLMDIADDTEEFIPDSEKSMKLATAYRQLADAIQEKMVTLKTL